MNNNKQLQAKIYRIAREARKNTEDIQERELIWPEDLSEMCGIASKTLYDKLVLNGYRPGIVVAHSHVFVYCRGYFIDITATQFGEYPKIIVTKSLEDEDFWDIIGFMREEKDIKKFFKDWPDYQNPYKWRSSKFAITHTNTHI